jgi:hypothetical protein
VQLWLAIRRLLPILAVLGLVLAPLTTPVVAMGLAAPMLSASADTAMVGMAAEDAGMSSDMPCCPPEKPVAPDCQKACPLAALCLAKCVGGLLANAGEPLRIASMAPMISRDEIAPASLGQAPPPPPPRS